MISQVETKVNTTVKIICYNALIEKNGFTSTVKNDAGWRGYSWTSRKQQLILKMVSESPDIICIQQIRHISKLASPNYYDFYQPLNQMGFEGVFAKRNGGEYADEGLAIFFNRQLYKLVQSQVLYFNDGTGRLALAITLRNIDGCILTVANTHIIYPSQLENTKKQIQLLSQWSSLNRKNIPCFLAGDFNLCESVSSHYQILKPIYLQFNDSHRQLNCKKPTFSLNLAGSNCPGMILQLMGTKIDYIFSSKDIQIIKADVIGKISDLPTMNQPSDHLPICATFNVPNLYKSWVDDVKKLKQIFIEVRQRQYNSDPKFKQFLQLFWLLPQTIKNTAYKLTYTKAAQLNLQQNNYQFGRIAFTNNTFHLQAIIDEQGKCRQMNWQVVKHNVMPHQAIIDILSIIQERVIVIQQLITIINTVDLSAFLQKFDDKLHQQIRNRIYGETYQIAQRKGIYNQHMDYGRVSFRNLQGWDIQNSMRIEAMKKLQLP